VGHLEQETVLIERVLMMMSHKKVRTFFDIDLDSLTYQKLDGRNKVPPAGDLSGQYWDEETHQLK
jgi:hypothetical protein